MHSIRSALARELLGPGERVHGQVLAEQDDIGLERRAAVAARDPGVIGCLARRGPRRAGSAPRQRRQDEWSIVPCTSISSRVPALRVQAVDVLGDHRVEQPRPLELGQRRVRAVGLLVLERLEALAVEVPEALRGRGGTRRCARPPSGRRSPTARCPGERKSGIPDGHRDPGAGQRHHRAGPADQLGEPCRAHAPFQCGRRLTWACHRDLARAVPTTAATKTNMRADRTGSPRRPTKADVC